MSFTRGAISAHLVLGMSDIVSVLDFGEMIATGPPAMIRADSRVRAAYIGDEAPV